MSVKKKAFITHPSAAYSMTLRLALKNVPGMFGKLAAAIGKAGGSLGSVDLVSIQNGTKIRDVVVLASSADQDKAILKEIAKVRGVELLQWSDRTFLTHLGGKIQVVPRVPVKSRDDLSVIYTPGVGRICEAIYKDPESAWNLTMKRNMVAIVTDGSRVLGLGNLGPEAALPVMEGKAILFKDFGGINAFPLCLATANAREFIDTVVRISPGFGGINLEDIAPPDCFQIERELTERLEIPVMHDDQHGTAIVVTAALLNALKIVHKEIDHVRVVVAGVGAAGTAVTYMLIKAGVRDVIGFDRAGAVYAGRQENMNSYKAEYAAKTNQRRYEGDIAGALRGADVFIGLSGPESIGAEVLKHMAKNPIVFCLSNPVPEVMPEELGFAAVVATGRSDYPNQVNNALAFPGVFRGALDVRSRRITEGMKIAAARALASIVKPKELSNDYILPSLFNPEVCPRIAEAVAREAIVEKVAREKGA